MRPHARRIPAAAGIGLRAPHVRDVLGDAAAPSPGSRSTARTISPTAAPRWPRSSAFAPTIRCRCTASACRSDRPTRSIARISRKLQRLVARVEPGLVSEHLCWSSVGGRHFNDLLPLPYTRKRSTTSARASAQVQDALGREILVENVSSYLAFADATIPEWEFVAALARRTGCRLLLDVNNVYVNAVNHGFDADAYIAAMPAAAVAEIHLAGFDATAACLVDTHGAPVAPECGRCTSARSRGSARGRR